MQPVAQRAQSALLAREAGFADAVHGFCQTFVATSGITIIALAAPPTPPTQRVSLGVSNQGDEPGSQ
jgi:hypothetical protein